MKRRLLAMSIGLLLGCSATAGLASPTLTYVGQPLDSMGYSFTADGGTFTFSGTGDILAPVAVQTGGSAEISSFGGFLGIPVIPSSDFTNRGVVTYGPDQIGAYSAFPTATEVEYSNGGNFFGLQANTGGQTYYGFAYTQDNVMVGYGFESVAGADITATTAISAAPEPSNWALLIAGVAMAGAALRIGRRRGGLVASPA